MKAEGGWGIVAAEQCDFRPTGDVTPFSETRLWGDMDIPCLAGMVCAVQEHGALATVELIHNGQDTGNIYSREVPIGPVRRNVTWLDHRRRKLGLANPDVAMHCPSRDSTC